MMFGSILCLRGLYSKGLFILTGGLILKMFFLILKMFFLAHCINQIMYVPVLENCSSGSVNY